VKREGSQVPADHTGIRIVCDEHGTMAVVPDYRRANGYDESFCDDEAANGPEMHEIPHQWVSLVAANLQDHDRGKEVENL
jgi:hypothetical protein